MTTFITRETVRDAFVTLFTTSAKWQLVFGYMPSESEVAGQSPFLVIRSGGTLQSMNTYNANPTTYRITFRNFVLCEDEQTEAQAEDKLDELDTTFRQIIRDNCGSIAGANYIRFEDAPSTTGYAFVGKWYRTEDWTVLAHYVTGGV